MRTVDLEQLRHTLSPDAVIAAVKEALIGNWTGSFTSVEPMQILFKSEAAELIGDCHVKAARSQALPYFVVKLATGFYRNPQIGLPVNDGLSLLLSAKTGSPLMLFQDQGWLTAWRTAAAGALAAGLARPKPDEPLGIIGSGQQAKLQALWICRHLGLSRVVVWSRHSDRAKALAHRLVEAGLQAMAIDSTAALAQECRLIITATPSTAPVLMSSIVRDGTHIVAVGADSPGKQELDTALAGRCAQYIVDDSSQCLAHGEFGAAVRAGAINASSSVTLGECLSRSTLPDGTITITDLTGLGAQDLAIAALAYGTIA